jgi:putative solute:sodium symporter small subunit
MTPPADTLTGAQRAQLLRARGEHWRRARRVTAILLLLWFGATFGTVFFARELSALTMFGWPLSFYLAAQGVALLNLAIIGFYALAMARLDRRFERALGEPAPRAQERP